MKLVIDLLFCVGILGFMVGSMALLGKLLAQAVNEDIKEGKWDN